MITVASMAEVNLADLREEYARAGLVEADLLADPIAMFRQWLDEVVTAGLHEPNAMVVATVSPEGQPSSRMVLLKGLDDEGFVFFTNTASRKGAELAANQACALLFPWHVLERQVRIEGTASPLSAAEVAAYFASRPRGSQLGAWASPQSRPVASREALLTAYDGIATRFPEPAEVPVPGEWGGYRVRPESVEFWQGRPGRMHDRLVYQRSGAAWVTQRLAP